eukprot:4073584-Amphidinium_carterae.1
MAACAKKNRLNKGTNSTPKNWLGSTHVRKFKLIFFNFGPVAGSPPLDLPSITLALEAVQLLCKSES